MKHIVICLVGVIILAVLGQFQPFRGWFRGARREPYLLLFIVPLWLLLAWPADTSSPGYREGDSLGAIRILRVIFFALFVVYTVAYHSTKQNWRIPRQATFRWFLLYIVVCAVSTAYSAQPA
jgi:hypothetical protein